MKNLCFFNELNKMRESLVLYMIMWQLFLHKMFSFNRCNPTGFANIFKTRINMLLCGALWNCFSSTKSVPTDLSKPVHVTFFSPFDNSSFIYVIRSDDFLSKACDFAYPCFVWWCPGKAHTSHCDKTPWLSESGKFPAALEMAVRECLCAFVASLSPITVRSCSLEDRCLLETK